jgi:hypothetical protein
MVDLGLSAEAIGNIRLLADIHYARERLGQTRPDLDTFSPMGGIAVLAEMGRSRERRLDRAKLMAALVDTPLEHHEQFINQWRARTGQGE